MDSASSEDSMAVSNKLSQLQTAMDSLKRAEERRGVVLKEGHSQVID